MPHRGRHHVLRASRSEAAEPPAGWPGRGAPSAEGAGDRRLSFLPVSVLETILYFAVPAVVLYFGIALLVVAPRMARRPRYRVGQPWPHAPLWWTANPQGAHLPAADQPHVAAGARAGTERGGARGSW
jgi:hypothetical protein